MFFSHHSISRLWFRSKQESSQFQLIPFLEFYFQITPVRFHLKLRILLRSATLLTPSFQNVSKNQISRILQMGLLVYWSKVYEMASGKRLLNVTIHELRRGLKSLLIIVVFRIAWGCELTSMKITRNSLVCRERLFSPSTFSGCFISLFPQII